MSDRVVSKYHWKLTVSSMWVLFFFLKRRKKLTSFSNVPGSVQHAVSFGAIIIRESHFLWVLLSRNYDGLPPKK